MKSVAQPMIGMIEAPNTLKLLTLLEALAVWLELRENTQKDYDKVKEKIVKIWRNWMIFTSVGSTQVSQSLSTYMSSRAF